MIEPKKKPQKKENKFSMKKRKILKKYHVRKHNHIHYKDHLMGKTAYRSQRKKRPYHHSKEYLKKHQKPKRHYKKKVKKTEEMVLVEVASTTPLIPVVKEKRGRKSRNTSPDRMYFTQETENAIIEYNSSEDVQIREDIYNNRIKRPFEKLVENIFNTFKFSYFETGPLDVQKETVSHLVSNIHKYDQSKGKAFAYFSIVSKHYLIALNNSTYKRRNQHVEIGEEHDEHTVQLQTEDKHHKDAEMKEFMQLMLNFWDINVNKIFSKPRDLIIAQAVIELFRQTQNISMFNKKALYLYIREISDCKTQQITKIINKMKPYQIKLYKSYINDGVVFNNLYDISK